MATYLSIDGTKGEYLQLPSTTFDKIVVDMLYIPQSGVWQYFLDARIGVGSTYLAINGNLSGGQSAWSAIYADGTQITDASQVPKNQRTVLELQLSPAGADDITIFSNYAHASNNGMVGNLYNIKVYNAGALVAHYDMSTGTVLDQSGNGNHATLVGGTWVQDAPSGTPVSIGADMRQAIYDALTKSFDTRMELYKQESTAFNTQQTIYQAVIDAFDMLQEIHSTGTPRTYSYDLRLTIYEGSAAVYDTQQAMYNPVIADHDLQQAIYKMSQSKRDVDLAIYADCFINTDLQQLIYAGVTDDFDMMQTFFNRDKNIVSKIHLEGNLALNIYLIGRREATIHLKGGV